MKKKIASLILICLMSLSTLIVSQAAEWKQDNTGWWYQNDDGSYPVNEWVEIEGKLYYFNNIGYMLFNTTTPDGYQVDENGVWIENPKVEFNTVEEINEYLYQNYRILHTNLGQVEVGHKSEYTGFIDSVSYSGNYVRENTKDDKAYDYMILTMWSVNVRKFYNEVMDSINYTQEEKDIFEQCFQIYQYTMAQDIIKKMPGKKIRGGFYSEGYKYPNIKVDYYNSVRYGWRNYERTGKKLEYYSFTLSDFKWIDLWDEIK